MSASLTVLFLALLLGLQPITTDLYLPALPALVAGFGAPMAQAQLTLTALLLAFGTSQLVWGPLSDRFGRRPVLLVGLALYVVAALATALAPTMHLLIVARTLQGAAMGAGVMCARAIIRDLYPPVEGARVMSKGLTGLAVIAASCPLLGGLLSELFNWRAALLAPAVFGFACLALVAWRYQETAPAHNAEALRPEVLLRTWVAILRHPTFLAFSVLGAASYGGLFTFLASSSFVLIGVLGLSKIHYSLVMMCMCVVYMGGTILCRRMVPRFGLRKSVALAAISTLGGGTTLGVLALAGVHSVWAIVPPFFLFSLAHGVHQPCSQSGAIGPFPQAAGTAAALNGFIMMAAAFAMGTWLGSHMDGSVFPLAYGVWFWSIVLSLSAWTLVQKYGSPAPAASHGVVPAP